MNYTPSIYYYYREIKNNSVKRHVPNVVFTSNALFL